jgi:hypothetical protein
MKAAEAPKATRGIRNASTFLGWLTQNDEDPQQLLDWCYFGFGAGRDTAQPHVQLLGAIPDGGNRYPMLELIARRVAALLHSDPTLTSVSGSSPAEVDHILYNLFALAANLNCPGTLADPLFLSYTSFRKVKREFSPSVRAAFTDALTNNH